ncbi:hypothetical protein C8Q76DRAFT_794730 [Earliella scabrosa]|nr:hypothetical protein C8Q76DRAFT_794730 [Earliella scabrosa]
MVLLRPLFTVILLNVLAVVVNTSARSTAEEGLIKRTGRLDEFGEELYLWKIGKDEERRLTTLLKQDFYDVGVEGTYTNSAPHKCSHCGKETEFIDWVYTALTRGVHSPEFIADSLRKGNTPKGIYHDVYCSHCGHLTAFRNIFGEEGGAPHISVATPYDRSTRTFGKREPEAAGVTQFDARQLNWPRDWLERREPAAAADPELENRQFSWPRNWLEKRAPEAEADPQLEDRQLRWPRDWLERRTPAPQIDPVDPRWKPGNWIAKREPEAAPQVDPPRGPPRWPGNWIAKREPEADKESRQLRWPRNWLERRTSAPEAAPEPPTRPDPRWKPGNWIAKREPEAAPADIPERPPRWPGNWIAKRDPEAEPGLQLENRQPRWPRNWLERRVPEAEAAPADIPVRPPRWPGNWIAKREPEGVTADAVRPGEQVAEKTAIGWCAACGPGNWVLKREPSSE